MWRPPSIAASASRAARAESGLALKESLSSIAPSASSLSSRRHFDSEAVGSVAAVTSRGTLAAIAAAAAADALSAWWAPTSGSATGAEVPAVRRVKGRPAEPVQCQVQHPHVGVLRVAEGQHRAVGEGAHRDHPGGRRR